ncbi:SSI family serine proteinase inhibitor [Streptomyces sp. DSM 44915]|uniref:SSI family serine proteinase inhibitor n=1 Tax=Streptomyces chisholmiae TaxID=3075540 RepID=A0ABU2JR21_9ACTN|nr:SSI family serine proteinase inhibitor [Streptomyces sp. DSM 44915]MDT0267189.1 SSI family serine proteinase inhibitor [Streptomyces sp. DSM 44915]
MPRRSLVSLALLTAAVAATFASSGPAAAHPGGAHAGGASAVDRLVITVSGAGEADGTVELTCAPVGGSHADPAAACAALAAVDQPFTPVADGTTCTFLYGGPATARVTGQWRGQEVDAEFTRGNGCEVSRWDRLVPALPSLGSGAA